MQRSQFLKLLAGATVGAFTVRGQWVFADPLPFVGAPGGLRPYLHLPRPDSIWVSWWTDADTDTYVDYGTSEAALNQTVTGSRHAFDASNAYHSTKLTGLQPDTYYYYRVRTENVTSATFRFKTAKALGHKTGKFRALIIGDNQILAKESAGDPYHRYEKLMERAITKLRAMHGDAPIEEIIDVILMPGDQVDVGTLNHWRNLHFYCSRLVSPNVAIMTTVGNHETYQDPGLGRYRELFRYEEVNYSGLNGADGDSYYAHQMSNLVFIHTNSEIGSNAAQTQWVTDLKDAYKDDTSVDWVVSICHRPYQAEQYLGDISGWLRNTAMPILNESDKHFLNIGAHHHIYHRGQVRDEPHYHIISGGSSWDQYWGQSGREADYDDVQKTINNWAWQFLEVDHATGKAEVTCYAEAHCRLPAASRWIYNSKEVDRFHRIRGKAAPNKPQLTNVPTEEATLPLTLQSSAFSTSTDELLNSVQYQVSNSPTFNTLELDKIVDFENFYGDTGSPDYLPVDINSGKNILQYELAVNSLPNGTYYARIRHRDRNVNWSSWSDSASFEITGSSATNPTISLPQTVYPSGASVTVDYAFGPGNAQDWIGIYKKGDNPGGVSSTKWSYVSGTAGQVTLSGGLTVGTEYFVGFFENNGYTEVATRVPFYYGSSPTLTTAKYGHDLGENVVVNFSGADVVATANKLHLYRAGSDPASASPLQSFDLTTASGSWTLAGLEKGYYFVVAQANTGTLVISDPVEFSVGDRIATLSLEKTTFHHGEDINASFINGPANPKDWLGIYRSGEEPGIGDLIHYVYVDGLANNNVPIVEDLPVGSYYLCLFTNDSYTEVSNRVSFTVHSAVFKMDSFNVEPGTNNAQLSWKTDQGVNYTLQRSSNLTDWEDISSFVGDGSTMQATTSITTQAVKAFYRMIIK
ncbi:fibronectin type III domain-containing protein [Rubritalea halochordaticola]|uniref:fibronectin type III domain-containing protein n=1 Tax=Rubritalea halochordaticola TaxID=714537 RepID=UPI0031FD547B